MQALLYSIALFAQPDSLKKCVFLVFDKYLINSHEALEIFLLSLGESFPSAEILSN